MTDEKHKDIGEILHKAAIWVLSASVSGITIVIYDLHLRTIDHSVQFSRVWSPELHRRVEDVLGYPEKHEQYRELWVNQQRQFNSQVREFMNKGDRFSRQDGDRLEERIRELEKEIRSLSRGR